jgi:transposase-like protein
LLEKESAMSKQRRQYTPEFKVEVVIEGLHGEKARPKGPRELCRDRDITDALYDSWRDQLLARAPAIFASALAYVTPAEFEANAIANTFLSSGSFTVQ